MAQFTMEDIMPAVQKCGLTAAEADELLFQVNKSGAVSLDLLHEYAACMTVHRGAAYCPRIDSCAIPSGKLWYIEPFCGSTTYVVETDARLVVIDTGFPCYAEELSATLKSLFPDYDTRKKDLILTHMDMDHAGLVDGFDTIWMSKTSYESFASRARGEPNLRETHPVRTPIYRISSLLSLDRETDISHMRALNTFEPTGEPLSYIGTLNLDPLSFAVYETSGGHVPGSIVLVEKENRLVFAGDVLVNPADMADSQKEFIRIGTAMLGTMNADSAKAKAERAALMEMVNGEGWIFCPGHGFPIRG